MIRFFVQGIPKTMSVGKTFAFRRGEGPVQHVQSRRNTEWGVVVGQIGRDHAPARPLDGPVSLTAIFYMPRPKSAAKKVVVPLTRPDVDNLLHKLSDQWNGVFWHDDSQITDLVVRKRFAVDGRTGAEFIVAPVTVLAAQESLLREEVIAR